MDLTNRALSDNKLDRPDYKNLQYNEDGSLTMDPEVDLSTASFNHQIKILGNIMSGPIPTHSYENTKLSKGAGAGLGQSAGAGPAQGPGGLPEGYDEDYMNDNPEGLDHTYTNQDDLLLQVCVCVCV